MGRVTSSQVIGMAVPIIAGVVAWILVQMMDSGQAIATQGTRLEIAIEEGVEAQDRIRNIEMDVVVIRSDVTHQGEKLEEIDNKIDRLLER